MEIQDEKCLPNSTQTIKRYLQLCCAAVALTMTKMDLQLLEDFGTSNKTWVARVRYDDYHFVSAPLASS